MGRGRMPFGLAVATLGQQLLDTGDGIALLVQQLIDPPDQIDILTPIITAVTASLNGAKLGELSLPETKYVLRDVQFGRHLADGPERIRRFLRSVHKTCSRPHLFTPSRRSWCAQKASTQRAAVGHTSPSFEFS